MWRWPLKSGVHFNSGAAPYNTSVQDAFTSAFPKAYGTVRLALKDVAYADPDDYDASHDYPALMGDRFLSRRLRGTLQLTDRDTGAPLDEQTVTLARVPTLTDRGSILHGGSDYAIIRQARLLPGVYHRRKENGELEAQFNVVRNTGHGFRVRLEPATGLYRLDVGTSQIALYPVLRALGVEDSELKRAWGERLWQANAAKPDRGSLAKAYAKLVRNPDPAASPERQAREVRDALEAMRVNPEAVALTLPELVDVARAKRAGSRLGAGVLLRTPSGWLLQENEDGTLRPVGGGYEPGDRLLRRTILRELQEELGIDPEEANRELLFLGKIVGGDYAGCGMFELAAPSWLTPGVYQASNSPDERINLVAVSSLEDPRYVGRPWRLKDCTLAPATIFGLCG